MFTLSQLFVYLAHLGHGCSIAAVKNGQSLDTSMGFSPLEGLMMGARSGDIDANVINYMVKKLDMSADRVIDILNSQSGFGAISGVADSRDLEDLYFENDPKAKLAIEMFCYRIAKYVASYIVPLGSSPDALIFTAGIGERSPLKRSIIAKLLEPLNFQIDEAKNDANETVISPQDADGPKMLVIPTNEELVIAQETYELLK